MMALRSAAMSERVGHDVPQSTFLQRIIAKCFRRSNGRCYVARGDLRFFFDFTRPNASETIGLQLEKYLQPVSLRLRFHAPLKLAHLWKNSQQVLNVVSDFVGYHIGLRKLTVGATRIAGAKFSLHLLEERKVEVDFLIIRTIEWSHDCFG